MRAKGISYDTGFLAGGTSTHEPFDPDAIRRDLRVIRDDLRCTAVRVTGCDVERLDIAASLAAELGLEVWFSPFTNDLTPDELLAVLADCADRAERLRRGGAEIVLLTGAELSMFTVGFLPGDTLAERLALLADPARLRAAIAAVPARLNDFLARAVRLVRERLGGRVSYAAIPSFEGGGLGGCLVRWRLGVGLVPPHRHRDDSDSTYFEGLASCKLLYAISYGGKNCVDPQVPAGTAPPRRPPTLRRAVTNPPSR